MKQIYYILLSISIFFGCNLKEQNRKTTDSSPSQERKIFKIGGVYTDNSFAGARLNDFSQLNDSTFQALIFNRQVLVGHL